MVATTTTATPNSSVAPTTPPSVPTSVKIVSGVLKAKSTITAYPSILALVVGIIVLICLLLLNPPFVHKRGMNPIYRREPDLFRAGIIALIVSALAYVTPIFILNKKS
jgi:glucose uptake protein GlcU